MKHKAVSCSELLHKNEKLSSPLQVKISKIQSADCLLILANSSFFTVVVAMLGVLLEHHWSNFSTITVFNLIVWIILNLELDKMVEWCCKQSKWTRGFKTTQNFAPKIFIWTKSTSTITYLKLYSMNEHSKEVANPLFYKLRIICLNQNRSPSLYPEFSRSSVTTEAD